MNPLPWIKLYVDFLNDPKIGRLPDTAKLRFVQLLLLAGEADAEGYLVDGARPLSDEDIAWRLHMQIEALQPDLVALQDAGLLVREGDDSAFPGAYLLESFSTRQGRTENDLRAYWREQKRRQRGEAHGDVPDMSRRCLGDVPDISRRCLGDVPDMSRTGMEVPGHLPDTSGNVHLLEEEGEAEKETQQRKQRLQIDPVPDGEKEEVYQGVDRYVQLFKAKPTPTVIREIGNLVAKYGLLKVLECLEWAHRKQIPHPQALQAIASAAPTWVLPHERAA